MAGYPARATLPAFLHTVWLCFLLEVSKRRWVKDCVGGKLGRRSAACRPLRSQLSTVDHLKEWSPTFALINWIKFLSKFSQLHCKPGGCCAVWRAELRTAVWPDRGAQDSRAVAGGTGAAPAPASLRPRALPSLPHLNYRKWNLEEVGLIKL